MKKIAVIGLGYVGLPLARLFATKYPVVGFDINQKRIKELREGKDLTLRWKTIFYRRYWFRIIRISQMRKAYTVRASWRI
nr:hypothetical protein [Sphingobacterium sp. T2]